MQALILAGGSGTRFWPLSRRKNPKQLLALEGERSLLQATVDRLSPLVEPSAVWVVTTRALAEAVRAQLPEVPAEQVLAEPEGRNTAPAIGWALGCMVAAGHPGVVAVLPADHRFADAEGFRSTLARAGGTVEASDWVMTLGVKPRWAETGYGYLKLGEALDTSKSPPNTPPNTPPDAPRKVARFREKPDPETAERYFRGGNHLWNAGIFVFRAITLLENLRRFEPELSRDLDEITAHPDRTDALYPTLKKISIDYAVMERLEKIATLPLDCGWSDLGSWEALAEVLPTDDAGNSQRGDVIAIEASRNLLVAEEGTIAVLGVNDLVVVRDGDTVLVLPRSRSQDVRAIVEALRAGDRQELL